MKKKREIKRLGPVITIIILILVVIFSSTVCNLLEITAERTEIARESLETSIITVNNVLTKDGIKFLLDNMMSNVQVFKPIYLLIVSLIIMSIGEVSGLFKAVLKPFRRINPKVLTMFTLFIGISSSFFGEYSYAILLPLTAMIYQYTGKKPLLGIMTMFIGITMGYGTGLIYNNDEIILSKLTTAAATLDVDKGFSYLLKSNAYISFISSIILTIVGSFVIHNMLDKKIPKTTSLNDEDDKIYSKKGLYYSNFALLIMVLIVIYMIIPGFNGSGFLLGEGSSYIERLLGETSPFYSGILFIILFMVMICSAIYGAISKNIKNSTDYSYGLSKNFEGIGYVFVLLFFTSQLIGILDYTNLGTVICARIVGVFASLPFSGLPLIITFFIIIAFMSLLVPSTLVKWELASPAIIPLMMKSNLTPNFTQFIFRAADGVGKSFTPLFPYFVVMIAFLEKYNGKEEAKVTVFGTIKTLMPTLLVFAGLWLLIITIWFILGLPIGPATASAF